MYFKAFSSEFLFKSRTQDCFQAIANISWYLKSRTTTFILESIKTSLFRFILSYSKVYS